MDFVCGRKTCDKCTNMELFCCNSGGVDVTHGGDLCGICVGYVVVDTDWSKDIRVLKKMERFWW